MLKLATAGTALFFVVALIFATAALGRWLTPWIAGRFSMGMARRKRLGKPVNETFIYQVDQKRRLHIAELAGRRFAILTGGPNDIMVALMPHSHLENEL